MSSWALFRYLTPFWEPPLVDPIFRREQNFPRAWRQLTGWVARRASWVLAGLAALVMVLAVLPVQTVCLSGPGAVVIGLFALLPSLLIWTLPLGLSLGPIIVREREGGTWDTLRTTPLDTSLIVLSKIQGALWPLRDLMGFIRKLLTVLSFGVGAFALIATAKSIFGAWGALPLAAPCGVGALVTGVGAVVFLADWAQQFVLMGVSAVAVSAAAPSQRIAVTGAVVAAFVAWLVNVLGTWFALVALPGHALSQPLSALPTLASLGPPVVAIAALPPGEALALILITLAIRELAIRAIWRWALRAASHP